MIDLIYALIDKDVTFDLIWLIKIAVRSLKATNLLPVATDLMMFSTNYWVLLKLPYFIHLLTQRARGLVKHFQFAKKHQRGRIFSVRLVVTSFSQFGSYSEPVNLFVNEYIFSIRQMQKSFSKLVSDGKPVNVLLRRGFLFILLRLQS